MSNNILDKIIGVRPRENAGSNAYNRFQFQVAFAAELIIKLSKENKNAIAFLDYLDDVVIVDNTENANTIIFYQVKSKDKNFITLNIILKNQWFEKMFYNKEQFFENSKHILVTNTGLNFDNNYILDNEPVNLVKYLESLPKDKFGNNVISKKIYASLSKNLGREENDIDLGNYWLLKTELTINDFERQIKGELQNFASLAYPKLDSQSLNVIYEKLYIELQRKQRKVYNPTFIEIDKLLSEKSYSTGDFERLVNTTFMVQIPNGKELFEFLRDNDLVDPSSLKVTMKLMTEYTRFTVESISSNNKIFTIAIEKLKSEFDKLQNIENPLIIKELINVLDSYDKICNTEFYTKYKYFIVYLFLYKIYEGGIVLWV